jgi:ammonia channel protein AmtB
VLRKQLLSLNSIHLIDHICFFKAGFAMLCAGCVQRKNVQNTLLKNLLDACGASIAFFAVGYAFAFGGTTSNVDPTNGTKTFMGTSNFFLVDVEDLSFWFFQYVFSAAAGMLSKQIGCLDGMSHYDTHGLIFNSFHECLSNDHCWNTR